MAAGLTYGETRGTTLGQEVEAGDLEAGELAFPTLVVSTPALRGQASAWLRAQFDQAAYLLQAAHCAATEPTARDMDRVLLAQAWQTCRMLLWMAQCTGLQDVVEYIERELTLDERDKALLRNAQDVAEARRARST